MSVTRQNKNEKFIEDYTQRTFYLLTFWSSGISHLSLTTMRGEKHGKNFFKLLKEKIFCIIQWKEKFFYLRIFVLISDENAESKNKMAYSDEVFFLLFCVFLVIIMRTGTSATNKKWNTYKMFWFKIDNFLPRWIGYRSSYIMMNR